MKCLIFKKDCDLLTCHSKNKCLWHNDVEKIKVTEGRILDSVHKSLQWQDGEIAGLDVEQLEQRVRGILLHGQEKLHAAEEVIRYYTETTGDDGTKRIAALNKFRELMRGGGN